MYNSWNALGQNLNCKPAIAKVITKYKQNLPASE